MGILSQIYPHSNWNSNFEDLILHKFEDLKIVNFLNTEEVYYLMARIIYVSLKVLGPAIGP